MCKQEQIKTKEKVEKRDPTPDASDTQKDEQDLSNYAQSLHKRKGDKQQDGSTSESGDAKNRRKALPKLDLVDERKGESTVAEDCTNEGRRVSIKTTDGRTAEMQYDQSGKPLRYRDFSGETFERQGDSDLWKSTTNAVQTEGVKIEVDESTKSVTMFDNATKNRVTASRDGIETVDYNGGGRTTRKVQGNEEWITVEGVDQPMRVMHVRENKLVSYTDSKGNTYNKTDRLTPAADGNAYSQQPIFEGHGPNGEKLDGDFTVTADRSGNVCVRRRGHEDESDYARREMISGTVITSNAKNTVREVATVEGLKIRSELNDEGIATKQLVTYPNGSGELTLRYSESGSLEGISGTVNGKQLEMSRQMTADYGPDETYHYRYGAWKNADGSAVGATGTEISAEFGQLVIIEPGAVSKVIDQNGTYSEQAGPVPKAKDVQEAPRMMQKTPPGVDVNKNIELAKEHNVCPNPISLINPIWTGIEMKETYDNGNWFNDQVTYGGPWDFKTPKSERVPGDPSQGMINDQMQMSEYEDYGNWHYGVVGRACGFTQTQLEKEAGAAQIKQRTSKKEWGDPGFGVPGVRISGRNTYGDDPRDNQMIRKGFADCQQYEKAVA